MTQQLIITRGIPASGKTTWARDWVGRDPGERARVNRDDLRFNLFGQYVLSHGQEGIVTCAQQAMVKALLRQGKSVVVDDTNLRAKTVKAWLQLVLDEGVTFGCVDFPTPLQVCLDRDDQRALHGRRVGEDVIRSFHDRYVKAGKLPPLPVLVPDSHEDDTDLPSARRIYLEDASLPTAWLVDVDGTLAHMTGRRPFEWHRVGEDQVDDRIREIVNSLAVNGHTVIVVSGRDAVCRQQTHDWLVEHDILFDELLMRPEGDNRKDSIVKTEIFWRDIAPRFNVRGVLDDRDQVVEMWRGLGLMCAQVAPGAF